MIKHRLLSNILLDSSNDGTVDAYKERIRDSLGLITGIPDPRTSWETLTTSGATDFGNGIFYWNDGTPQIFRFTDRVFIGEVANNFAGYRDPDPGTSWVTSEGAFYTPMHSVLAVSTYEDTPGGGKYAISGNAKVETGMNATQAIGVIGGVIANKASSGGWAFYGDVIHTLGSVTFGMELACKNQNAEVTADSYATSTGGGTIGLHLNTGDDAYGGVAVYNPTAAINIAGGNSGNLTRWNLGIRFASGGLKVDGSGYAVAMSMAQKHTVEWMVSAGNRGAIIRSDVSTASHEVKQIFENDTFSLYGTNDKRMLKVSHASSGVNDFNIINAATGSYPILAAEGDDSTVGIFYRTKGNAPHRFTTNTSTGNEEFRIGGITASPANYVHTYAGPTGSPATLLSKGSDTDVDLALLTQGAGVLKFGTHTAIGAETVTGYITIKDAGGTTRKIAVVS